MVREIRIVCKFMLLKTTKSTLKGSVTIPGSKSHTIRAVAIAALAEGTSRIHKPLYAQDTLSAVQCYHSLGAIVDTNNPEQWHITGVNANPTCRNQIIDVGNSGTTLRLAVGSAALNKNPHTYVEFTGDQQLKNRLMRALNISLQELGATIQSLGKDGCAPLRVWGTLRGGKTTIECFTSQFLSSLLLACPLAERDTEIIVPLLNEPDYAQMTVDWLKEQAIQFEHDGLRHFWLKGGQKYRAFDKTIPADFSSATFFLCAAALCGQNVRIEGLDFSDSQPDKAVAEYLQQMGADVRRSENTVEINRSDLKGIDIDMNRTPDALPAMAVTACFASGVTRLLNVPQARKKETDRIGCMAQELTKLGARVEELPDGLIIYGGHRLKAAPVSGHSDHRIVMALSLAGLILDESLMVDTAEAMNVTFPEFVQLMKQLGANISLIPSNTEARNI